VQSGRAWTLWDRLLTPWPYVWVIPWKHREALGGHLFRVMVLIFGVVAVAVPYFGTNIWAETFATTVWDPEIALDRQIPVIGWMIAPYMALYLFYPATLLTNPMDDRHRLELISGVQMLSMITLLCSVIFITLPAEIDMRDQIDFDSLAGWEVALFESMHFMDNPWNAWPSLHIAHSYFLARAITRWVQASYSNTTARKLFLTILWVEFVLLSISILTTKQHYIWDLFTGLLAGFTAWYVAEPFLNKVRDLADDKVGLHLGVQ